VGGLRTLIGRRGWIFKSKGRRKENTNPQQQKGGKVDRYVAKAKATPILIIARKEKTRKRG